MSIAAVDGDRRTLLGVLCGAGAGALWGLVFLAPELGGEFSPLQLTVGRYLAFGAISCILVAPRWRALVAKLKKRDWLSLALLALVGNTLYYSLLSTAVQMGGIAMTSLVIGLLPVLVTLVGTREQNAIALRRLVPSLLLGAAGVLCVAFEALSHGDNRASDGSLVGLVAAIGALVSWTVYAVGNSRCLTRMKAVSVHDWNLLTGLNTGAQSLVLAPFALTFGASDLDLNSIGQLTAISVGVALLASIGGNALWHKMSRLLPLTLSGQMILFETLFALAYGLVWEHRPPTLWESSALVLVVASVLSCIAVHRNTAPKGLPEI